MSNLIGPFIAHGRTIKSQEAKVKLIEVMVTVVMVTVVVVTVVW